MPGLRVGLEPDRRAGEGRDDRAASGGYLQIEPALPVAEGAAERSRRRDRGADPIGDQRRRAAKF